MFLKRTYPGYSLGSLQGRCSRELSRASSPHFLLKPIRMHISPERELLADIVPTPAKKIYHRMIGIFEQKSKEMYGPRTKKQMRNPRSILQNILCLDHVMTRIWKRRVRTLRAPKVHNIKKYRMGIQIWRCTMQRKHEERFHEERYHFLFIAVFYCETISLSLFSYWPWFKRYPRHVAQMCKSWEINLKSWKSTTASEKSTSLQKFRTRDFGL